MIAIEKAAQYPSPTFAKFRELAEFEEYRPLYPPASSGRDVIILCRIMAALSFNALVTEVALDFTLPLGKARSKGD